MTNPLFVRKYKNYIYNMYVRFHDDRYDTIGSNSLHQNITSYYLFCYHPLNSDWNFYWLTIRSYYACTQLLIHFIQINPHIDNKTKLAILNNFYHIMYSKFCFYTLCTNEKAKQKAPDFFEKNIINKQWISYSGIK